MILLFFIGRFICQVANCLYAWPLCANAARPTAQTKASAHNNVLMQLKRLEGLLFIVSSVEGILKIKIKNPPHVKIIQFAQGG